MYEVGLSRGFRAQHVMPGVEGPEGELHEHDYRLDVVVRRDRLDDLGMVVDLDELARAADGAVAVVADRDLEAIRPPDAYAVTVEVLAKWAHERISGSLPDAGELELSVRAWESDDAFGGYAGPGATSV